MRNTTKLKHLLSKYDIMITMPEEDFFRIAIIDKQTHVEQIIEGKNYSEVLRKAYSAMLKEIKQIAV
jgi:hypothetical protein